MGRPEVPIIPEKAEIDTALEGLVNLYDRWELNPKTDWVLVDEFAMLLQGYKIYGEELSERHLDTFVSLRKLPWIPQDPIATRQTVPPAYSEHVKEYNHFMKSTGFGLKIHLAEQYFLQLPCNMYSLPSGIEIRLLQPLPFLQEFYKNTLLTFTVEHVGEAKTREWERKLVLIREAALESNDQPLAQLAESYIQDWEARKGYKSAPGADLY